MVNRVMRTNVYFTTLAGVLKKADYLRYIFDSFYSSHQRRCHEITTVGDAATPVDPVNYEWTRVCLGHDHT
ncbi:hypothetical protein KQX54_000854 [Cotesia glomerata]|uniref:Uncharacterized protein n=1 Tax=Cotesia glomerata TaxID=32391 RepID=A0AAV7INQ3_COTGL|nr:hypothetical protein KQX54_000854 [Cotesia glomerata]